MNQVSSHLISAYAQINQHVEQTSLHKQHFDDLVDKLKTLEITPSRLAIEPLSIPWNNKLQDGHFRSGCAPIMALEQATRLISQGVSAVIIEGDEPLSSGYTREQRHQLMAVYTDQPSIAELYSRLAMKFISQQDISEQQFTELADSLYQNHLRVYQRQINENTAHFKLPSSKWLAQVTPLFRGVDCANPLVDFSGKILLCSEDVARRLNAQDKLLVSGVALGILDLDNEPQAIDQIVKYHHLTQAFTQASTLAKVDFVSQFKQGNALLEAYTCYPVVPMAFLINNGFVDSLDQLPAFLGQHEITVTGGMNLARAPWNNPSLNALINMYHQLLAGEQQYGMVHGNGGLGYRQGIAILEKK